MKQITIHDIHGFQIGQSEHEKAGTGCTVILCKKGAVAGVDVRGGGPATRETDVLNPMNMVDRIHAVMLSGGSAFGLDAASGAMQYLEEHKCGFDMKVACIPIVCAVSLFDLSVGDAHIRPDKDMGYQACINSETNKFQEGNYGAGCGASVGKLLGFDHAMKGGIGASAVQIGDIQVGAIVAVNACGNVIDDQTNTFLAGVYNFDTKQIIKAEDLLYPQMEQASSLPQGNTTIACVLTNAKLTKAQCTKIAGISHNGYARAIRPVHTMSDGDTIFVMSSQEVEAMPDAIGVVSTNLIAEAIQRAIKAAKGAYGLRSWSDNQEELSK